jgi:hypothetical protein
MYGAKVGSGGGGEGRGGKLNCDPRVAANISFIGLGQTDENRSLVSSATARLTKIMCNFVGPPKPTKLYICFRRFAVDGRK